MPSKQWGSTQYFFNRRTARPDSGGVLDGGARPIGNSTYEQAVYNIRLLQAVGSVTGFAQTVTRDLVGDLRQLEIDGTVQSLMWTMECDAIWGNDGATANGQFPIYSGFDSLVNNFSAGTGSSAFVNALDVNNNFTLARLDELIDLVETNAAMPIGSQYMFLMSPRMQSAVSQALISQQRFMGQTTVAAGLTVPNYRDVPIIKSSFLSPRTFSMGTVTSTTTGSVTGASLTQNANYKYYVTAVIARFGEIGASPEVSQTTGNVNGQNIITLTVAAPSNMLDGAAPILYKVYRTAAGGVSGSEVLLGVVDAFDTTGVATTSIIDTGTNLQTNSSANTSQTTYQGAPTGNLGWRASGQEDIYLVPKDQNFLVRPYTRDVQVIPLAPTTSAPDTLPFALVSDTTIALRAPKYAGRLARVTANI